MASKEQYNELLTSAGLAGLISVVAAVVRHIILERHGGWKPLLRGMVASALVAVIVGWGLFAVSLPFPVQMAIVGMCAYLGDDILLGILVIGNMIRNDPTSFITKIVQVVRGSGQAAPKKKSSKTPAEPKE